MSRMARVDKTSAMVRTMSSRGAVAGGFDSTAVSGVGEITGRSFGALGGSSSTPTSRTVDGVESGLDSVKLALLGGFVGGRPATNFVPVHDRGERFDVLGQERALLHALLLGNRNISS